MLREVPPLRMQLLQLDLVLARKVGVLRELAVQRSEQLVRLDQCVEHDLQIIASRRAAGVHGRLSA
ncbi:MAG TPA: hypothetical protein VIJ22_08230 [Polyangiaceae bacterium]